VIKFFFLKVPRQCQIVLLVKIGWRKKRTLGNEKIKGWEGESFKICIRGKKMAHSLQHYNRNFILALRGLY
jgi:hypothetical protein